jgi:HSP20 family protein
MPSLKGLKYSKGGAEMNEMVRKGNSPHDEYVMVPLADIYETEDQYTLKLEMPGVARDRLDITLENNELEIRGTLEKYKPEGKELKYAEFTEHDFYRKFNVGNDIDRQGIKASLQDGVLTLVLQKQESVKPKKIPITVK